MKCLSLLLLFSLTLSACVSYEERVKAFGALDCETLDQKIDFYQQRMNLAQTTVARTDGQEIYGDERRLQQAEKDGLIAQAQLEEAARYLQALGRVKRDKGC